MTMKTHVRPWPLLAAVDVVPAIGYAAGADAADAAQKKDIGALRALVQQAGRCECRTARRHDGSALGGPLERRRSRQRSCCARARTPKARNRYGATPLSEAVTAGSAAMVEALLEGRRRPENADH